MANLCGARIRMSAAKLAKSPEELTKLLRRNRCKRPVVPGRNRCHLHGGYSTGPRTAEGMAKMVAAATAGRTVMRGRQKSQVSSGKHTLPAKLIRRSITQCITARVSRRQEQRGLKQLGV